MSEKVRSSKIQRVDYADEYDDMARELESHSADIIFGLLFEYIQPGQSLLDLGIGTGISSNLFKKYGLKIYGLDNSPDMLDVCEKKNIAVDLKLFDLENETFPYGNQQFDHIISVGVFHFFHYLDNFFKEAKRILKPGGTFSFTVIVSPSEIDHEFNQEYEIDVYSHSEKYVKTLIDKYKLNCLKKIRFLTFKDISKTERICFEAYVLSNE
ncbi:MAG: class I SAM-dependent DNA methyltransferase [Methanomicrobiales archaeon]